MPSVVIDSVPNSFEATEFQLKVQGKAWFYANVIIWFTIFVYPLLSILDFIYAGNIWQEFFLFRVFVAVVLYFLHQLATKSGRPPYGLLHTALALMSVVQALECNLVPQGVLLIFFVIYTAIFISFNLIVFWEAGNSFVHLLVAVVLLSGFQIILNVHSLNDLITGGGFFFLIIAAISCAIPQVRLSAQLKEMASRLNLEKTNAQLEIQRDRIEQQNDLIIRQNNELQRMNEQKSTLIQIAGHDIKNILGGILMPAEMLDSENDNFTAEQKELAGFIHQSSTRMAYLLNQLLDLQEAQTPEIQFNFEIVNANREALAAIQTLREKALAKKITLVENMDQVPVSVRLDKVFAGQVFFNLLNNAIKFSQENAVIEIRTSVRQNWFVYEINDNGTALGMQRMTEMFSKLGSLKDASLNEGDRQGLGLSIAKLLTEAMQGKLSYDSDQALGNRYEVRFQLV